MTLYEESAYYKKRTDFKMSVRIRPETETTRSYVHLTTNEYRTSAILVMYAIEQSARQELFQI